MCVILRIGVLLSGLFLWGYAFGAMAMETLEDTDHDVRLEAARSLASVAHPSSKQALAEAIQDPDPALQDLAVTALRRISPVDYGQNVARWKAHLQGEAVEEPSLLARQWESWNR